VTFRQNEVITTRPNELRDQTLPNTLGGVSGQASVSRRIAPIAPRAIWAVVVAAGLALLFVIASRIG
jgi:hypothetical protein